MKAKCSDQKHVRKSLSRRLCFFNNNEILIMFIIFTSYRYGTAVCYTCVVKVFTGHSFQQPLRTAFIIQYNVAASLFSVCFFHQLASCLKVNYWVKFNWCLPNIIKLNCVGNFINSFYFPRTEQKDTLLSKTETYQHRESRTSVCFKLSSFVKYWGQPSTEVTTDSSKFTD